MSLHRFTDLDRAIDEVHALFDAWDESGALARSLDDDRASVLRLAVHEWVANLVQHAAFPAGAEVTLDVDAEADGVRCTVEDTSVGFDFAGQVDRQHARLGEPAPSERGRGLLMLITCTEDLSFRPAEPGRRQAISFRVRGGADAPLFAPFFRPEDLVDDFSLADALGPDALGPGAFPSGAFPDAADAFWPDAPDARPADPASSPAAVPAAGLAGAPSGDGAAGVAARAPSAPDTP